MERGERFEALIDRAYDHLADLIVASMRGLPSDMRQSGEDSPLTDVWLEYASQIQGEESVFFEAYEDVVLSLCEECVKKLTRVELELLWLDTEAYRNWTEDGSPAAGLMATEVTTELSNRVRDRAADTTLPA